MRYLSVFKSVLCDIYHIFMVVELKKQINNKFVTPSPLPITFLKRTDI